ncbi:MAG: para-aminobenzoate synthase, (PABA) [Icmadophila ericetorum]|nr:para-aminobenzoate synthase, (PABA) [Icmadophila ericetorum]
MRSRILFIDAYDSFANNIISLLETDLGVEVTKIRIDSQIPHLPTFLKQFAGIVLGPGPGDPQKDTDVGLFNDIWRLNPDHLLPVLGICLGFQSLVLNFGGCVKRLPIPRHGIETIVTFGGPSLFATIGKVKTVQYHSLYASLEDLGLDGPDLAHGLWSTSSYCPELEPLAWDFTFSETSGTSVVHRRQNPSRILMAVKHRNRPFCGIQFHPESICSDSKARNVVRLWWQGAEEWHRVYNRDKLAASFYSMQDYVRSPSLELPDQLNTSASSPVFSSPISSGPPSPASSVSSFSINSLLDGEHLEPPGTNVETRVLALDTLTVPSICNTLKLCRGDAVILDSETRQMPEVSNHSIIGVIDSNTLRLEYNIGSRAVRLRQNGKVAEYNFQHSGGTIFSFIKSFIEEHKARSSCTISPFWGGLIGYITYEACLETIDIHTKETSSCRPDLAFAFVERSVVIDHAERLIYIQTIKPNDKGWLTRSCEALNTYQVGHDQNDAVPPCEDPQTQRIHIERPIESIYKAKIGTCQELINAGESYELCLTNQAHIKTNSNPQASQSSWPLYCRLRCLNPAPFAAYLRLGPLTLLSTSPERFLCWGRPLPNPNGQSVSTCQFRPIKGTVQKHQTSSIGETRTLTLAEAAALLSTSKERAENLMIVDLIRHDLCGVVGFGNVEVKKLMVVEEYATMYQLVSVIEGNLLGQPSAGTKDVKTGIDVLSASLPPGSMTGAPKKRSCQLLQQIEDEPRSVYSGVVGYMCVGGGGDFSVVIRSMFKWDDESAGEGTNDLEDVASSRDTWHVGAGGAVTSQSSEKGEWEEMLTKLRSTLRLFERT